MKKITFVFAMLMCFFSVSAFASSESYTINDNAVEATFHAAKHVNSSIDLNKLLTTNQAPQATLSDKEPIVAILLDLLIGGLAIHRVYLGGRPTLILLYFITCGGIFGILPLGDLIVLAINYDDISKYVDNDKFIMW